MATVSVMIDLKEFQKIGVRIPAALKRRVKQLVLDLENEGVGYLGDEMTMEGIFAVAVLEILEMKPGERAKVFARRDAALAEMFEAEMPAQEDTPERAGAVEGDVGRVGTSRAVAPVKPRRKRPDNRKETG